MKKLLFILLFIPLTLFSQENVLNRETIKDEYIKEIDGILYYNEKPFTGMFYEEYENGKLEYEDPFIDGVRNGTLKFYYESGKLRTIANYKDGKKNGLYEHYYQNEKVMHKEYYKDGNTDGLLENYYPNGQIKSKFNYKDGKQNGLLETYYSNGQIELKVNYKDDNQDGLVEMYYPNGQIKVKQYYKDGKSDGLVETYYSNGQIEKKGNYKDGKKDGLFETYYKNGKLKDKILYEYDEIKLKFRSLIGDTNIEDVNVYDLEAMIRLFLKDCELNNIKLPSDYKITSTFEPLDDGVLALAFGIFNDEEIIIRVNPKEWSNASNPKRWYIMYHELGHDVLNLQHGQGGKMMFNYTEKDYTWDDFFKDKDYMFNSMKSK